MVSHLPWAQGIGGSNPLTSTSSRGARDALPVIARSPAETMRRRAPPARIEMRLGTSLSLQVWLSGRALRCQPGNRGFESRHLLQRPCSTTVVHRFRKPKARVRFSMGARRLARIAQPEERSPCKRGAAGAIPAVSSNIPGWPSGESTRLLTARRNPTLVRIQPPERCVVFHAGEADW